jgi:hypothetical protein
MVSFKLHNHVSHRSKYIGLTYAPEIEIHTVTQSTPAALAVAISRDLSYVSSGRASVSRGRGCETAPWRRSVKKRWCRDKRERVSNLATRRWYIWSRICRSVQESELERQRKQRWWVSSLSRYDEPITGNDCINCSMSKPSLSYHLNTQGYLQIQACVTVGLGVGDKI